MRHNHIDISALGLVHLTGSSTGCLVERSSEVKKHQDRRAWDSSSSSLDHHAQEFQRWLEDEHYASATLAEYRRCLTAFIGVVRRARLDAESLTESAVERFIGVLQRGSCQRKCTAYVVRQFVRYLIERGVTKAFPPHPDSAPHGKLRREYELYLRNERGLSERTIYHCWRFADRFLQFRFNGKSPDFAKIAPVDVVAFMQQLASARQP